MTQTVADQSDSVKQMSGELAMIRALMGGTAAMRKATTQYLPAWPNEDPESYRTRLAISTLFPAYSRTVTTLTGKPFSRPVTYSEDFIPELKKWMENDADLQGRNLDTFAACVLESALAYGLTGILVEFPKVEPGTANTKAQEMALGLRPYFVHIEPWQLLGWKSQQIMGVQTITQLRFVEKVSEDDGPFIEKSVDQVRVLTPGAWETFRQNDKGEWLSHDAGVTTMGVIPFVPVYGNRTGFLTAKPPMLEMAYLNVKHWQSQSDQDNILHVARVPILYVSGVDDDRFSMTIGASAAVKLPTGATAGFVEHAGSAIGSGRTSLEDLKEEMRQAGAELLVLQPGQVTATQIATENAVGMCALQRITAATEDALDTAMDLAAQWIGQTEGGHITLFKDFGAASLAEASADLLVSMTQAGYLSKMTLLAEVKRRGILSSEVDPAAELESVDAQGPALGAGDGNS